MVETSIEYTQIRLDRFRDWLQEHPRLRDQFLQEIDEAFREEIQRTVTLEDLFNDLGGLSEEEVYLVLGIQGDQLISALRYLILTPQIAQVFLSDYRLTSERHHRYVLLTSIFVSQRHRGLGQGRKLLKHLEPLLDQILTPRLQPTGGQKRPIFWLTLQVYKNNYPALLCYLKSGYEFLDFSTQDYLLVKRWSSINLS